MSGIYALAIDTTGEFGSLALVYESGVVEEVEMHSADGYGHILFAEIAALLARHSLDLSAIGVFAAASGPGSFTGVRMGLTAAKGLGEAAGRKVVGVSNLMALASLCTSPLRAAVIDARRGDVYSAVYNCDLEPACVDSVGTLAAFLADLPQGEIQFVTDGSLAGDKLSGEVLTAPRALAGAIGRIALEQFKRGLAKDPSDIDANYVRRSDAQMLWKDR